MSQGIMRKSQPFTIGTKLSQTKCPDFSVAGCDVTALESCSHSLSDRVSQYLALTSLPPRSILSAHHPVRDLSEDEQFSQGSLVRSIKKITLSSHSGEAHSKGTERPSARGVNLNSVANYNNNNSRMLRNVASDFIVSPSTCSVQNNLARTNGGPSYLSRSIGNPSNNMFNVGPNNYTPRATDMSNHIPRANGDPSNIVRDIGSPNKIVGDIVGPTNIVRDIGCPINLALRTDEVQSNQQVKSNMTSLTGCPGSYPLLDSMARVIEEQNKKTPQMKVPGSPSLTRIFRKRLDSTGGKKYLLENTAPYITELSREITQAETWVRGKLHDLADRCDTSPLQDWEQGTLTLLSDIRAYEPTIMRLTQMGENLTKSHTPSAETVQTQLQTLRDQWLLLKQTTTNQSKALSGAKTLQEFNKKADELEMWMREKEERPSLNHILDESNDKVQLTRRILDLKQEQVHYRNLQENINSLAQKLEKHGRAESKGTSTRRKHLNKMWLKLQDTLQEHQQTLQLALDAASLWQQSDTILRAIEDKMNMATAVNGEDSEKHKTRDIRDIAGQIMILDLTVSQVSSLHPILAIRAAQKQCQVKESWAQLQQALRTKKSPRPAPSSAFTREKLNQATPSTEQQSSVGNLQQGILGSLAGGIQKEKSALSDVMCKQSDADDIRRCHTGINTGRTTADDQEDEAMLSLPHEASEVRKLLDELDSTELWLQNLEDLLSEPTAMRSPQVIRKDLRNIAVLEKEVKSRGLSVHSLRNRARGPKVLEGRKEMEDKVQEVEERFRMVQDVLRRRVSDLRDSLVLSEFMKVVQMEEEKRNKELLGSGAPAREGPQVTEADDSGREIFTPLEELQEAVEMLNEAVKERERMVTVTKETENLEKRLSVVVRMVNCAKCRLNKLKRETEEAEQSYVVMRHQDELTDLQGLFIQQQDLEAEICGALKLEVRRLEEHTDQLHDMSLEKAKVIGQQIQDTLQAWSQLEKKVNDNKTRLQRTSQLRRFFQCYLAMISWTEDTRTQMLLGNPEEPVGSVRREELEQNIEEKLREFEELASVGWKFIGEEHELTQTIRERLEEVQGMLSWVLMRWRCQKHQMVAANKTERRKTKEAAPEMSQVLTTEPPLETSHQDSSPEVCESDTCVPPPARTSRPRRYERQAHSPMSLQHHLSQLATDIQKESQLRGDQEGTPGPKRSEGPLWLEPREPPVGAESVEQEETVYTVSTFLHVNKSEQPQLNACYSLTVPRPSKKALAVDRFSLPTKSAIGTPSSMQPKIKSCSLFNSLKRKEKTQRRTVQGIMGLYPNDDPAKKVSKYHTHTWPPRQHRKVSHRELSPELSKLQHYVKNPLESDINDECVTTGPVLQKADINKSFHFGSPMLTSGCRHVALGSVFSVEVAKDAISTQQTFKVPTKECDSNGSSGEDLTSVRVFDSLKTNVAHETESTKPCTGGNQTTKQDLNTQGGKAWPEELTSSLGYCRQNLHGYGNPNSQQQERPTEHMVSLGINRSSPFTLSNEPLEPNGYHAKMLINKHRSNNVSNSFATNSESPSRYHSEDVIYSTSNVCEAEELVQYAEFSFTKEGVNESLVDTLHNSYLEPINTSTETIRHNYNSPGSYSPQRNPAVTIGTSSLPEVLHPDHEFLEQDDEELEGIWNNAKMGVENCTTQDSYITLHKTGDSRNTAKPADIWTIKKPPIVTVSKPNMLVATFTLPNSALLSVDTEKQRGIKVTEEQHRYGHGDGASHQKVSQTGRGSTPDPRPADPCKEEETKRKKQTSALNLFHKLDFQLMEGPLEKKHILQQGGKKASCRTWSMCHVVLVRRTLCFYNDRKHPTKSSASAPPLHLTGAVCTPETDYTKRDNCFRLRLYDGSEYLLRAPSPALLQEWVSKVQHNAGLEDRDLLGDTALGGDITTSPSRSLLSYRIPDLCQPIPVFDREKLEKAHREHLEPTNQRVGIQQDPCRTGAHPARSQVQFLSPAESCRTPDSFGQEDDLALVTNRRRSRSFSSAVYQKMSSFSSPQKTSPSYSVTLYITDPPAPRGRSHSFAAGLEVSHLERSGQGSHAGVLKPRNKSVFRKLFRKKD